MFKIHFPDLQSISTNLQELTTQVSNINSSDGSSVCIAVMMLIATIVMAGATIAAVLAARDSANAARDSANAAEQTIESIKISAKAARDSADAANKSVSAINKSAKAAIASAKAANSSLQVSKDLLEFETKNEAYLTSINISEIYLPKTYTFYYANNTSSSNKSDNKIIFDIVINNPYRAPITDFICKSIILFKDNASLVDETHYYIPSGSTIIKRVIFNESNLWKNIYQSKTTIKNEQRTDICNIYYGLGSIGTDDIDKYKCDIVIDFNFIYISNNEKQEQLFYFGLYSLKTFTWNIYLVTEDEIKEARKYIHNIAVFN